MSDSSDTVKPALSANIEPFSPPEADIIAELETYAVFPSRRKLLESLRARNNWVLGEPRLKKIMSTFKFKTDSIPLLTKYVNSLTFGPPDFALLDVAQGFEPSGILDAPFLEADDGFDILIPQNALAAQDAFFLRGTRNFILYGRGQYNYAVTPNSNVGIMLMVRRIPGHSRNE